MIECGLYDSTFVDQPSATLGGENYGELPQHINWVRETCMDITFFTDMRLEEAANCSNKTRKIAWLLEPRAFSSSAYDRVAGCLDMFDYILSHDAKLLGRLKGKGLWCPVGGSWIKQHGVYKKDRAVSMITTDKYTTTGHILRHEARKAILARQALEVHFFGRGSFTVETKSEALRGYQYSIVVESSNAPFYFSEKLIDCISQGTVAIYWGTPAYASYFHPDGIIQFDTIEELIGILEVIMNGKDNYAKREHGIKTNSRIARQYRCVEDWIFLHYPWLFEK